MSSFKIKFENHKEIINVERLLCPFCWNCMHIANLLKTFRFNLLNWIGKYYILGWNRLILKFSNLSVLHKGFLMQDCVFRLGIRPLFLVTLNLIMHMHHIPSPSCWIWRACAFELDPRAIVCDVILENAKANIRTVLAKWHIISVKYIQDEN